MNLILLGAPGAGKGTQAEIICAKLNIPSISTGNILRAAVKEGTEMGLKAKSFMDAGALVPDEVIIGILKERLAQADCANGFILDGVPRTIAQAEAIETMGIRIDKVLELQVEDSVIVERMSGRRVCEKCGASYHILNKKSKVEGVMHACGHDIHAAVLYGTLLRLSAERNFEGTLFGIFQPGEESNPGGASKVLAENPFEGYTVLAVVGEHVEPALDAGTLGFRAGKYMASNDELRLTLEGAGGHAAMRAEHRDTVSAAAQLILHLTALNTPERVVSIGKVEAAGATNVIPDRVYMEGTMRTFDERERAEVKRRIEELAAANDASYGVRTRVHFTPGYPCVVNDPELIRQAVALAETEGIPFQMLPLRMTSEDFGFYGTRYPAIFYRLGVGPGAGKLHTSTFNPDEAAIPTGIRFMELLARNYFNR